jgi:N-dimethylarginine dimethylaminohydrolase
MQIHVQNETAPLQTVVLGIGTDRGKPRLINPVMRYHVQQGTYPGDEVIQQQLKGFARVLEENGVEILYPKNLPETEQIFTRDLAFVIDDKLFLANMKEQERKTERRGIRSLLTEVPDDQFVELPEEVTLEGGDVILWNDYVFVGLSDRTNREGLDFLTTYLPHKKVIGFELVVTDDPGTNTLHLDCAFQPIGDRDAILYEPGFTHRPEALLDLFPEKRRVDVDQEQFIRMCPNVFSVAPDKIVVESGFRRLKKSLQKRGYDIIEVPFAEVAKLGGLLRCSTMPLRRI